MHESSLGARGELEKWKKLHVGGMILPTMFLASLDIKTAFDEARPRYMAKIMENHDKLGWLIAAFLREMSGLERMAMLELVESSFAFKRCLRQGSVEAFRLWQKMATRLLANVEEAGKKKNGSLPGLRR